MAMAKVNGLSIAYELIGDDGGRPWIITLGGRYIKDYPGVRELAPPRWPLLAPTLHDWAIEVLG
jgi:hypothetical protein